MLWSYLWPLMALPLIEAAVSTNARCGNTNDASPRGMSCLGSRWGNCCSQYGYCGSTTAYCGAGCQSSFGTCSIAASSSVSTRTPTPTARSSSSSTQISSAAPSATLKISSNARCGFLYSASPGGMTCLGSKYGDCCSQYSYCGSTQAYCGTGCQSGFGKCNPASLSSSSSAVQSSSTSSFLSATTSSSTSTESSSSSASTSTPDLVSSSASSSSSDTPTSTSMPSSSSSSSATSTSMASSPTSSTPTSSSCVPPAPTVSCVPYPTCPTFNTPLTSGCPTNGGMCNNNYFTRCTQAPAVGSVVIAQLGNTVADGDACRVACDARDNCAAFVFSATSPIGTPICDLYSSLNGFSASFVNTYLRICPSTC